MVAQESTRSSCTAVVVFETSDSSPRVPTTNRDKVNDWRDQNLCKKRTVMQEVKMPTVVGSNPGFFLSKYQNKVCMEF